MPLRLANALLLVALVAVVTGTLSVLWGSGAWSWVSFSEGVWWYTAQRWQAHPLLTAMLGVTLLFGLGLAVVTVHSWWRFRSAELELQPPAPQQDPNKQLFSIRRRLDREIARPRAEPERVLDVLLSVMVDHDSEELLLKVGPMVVEVQLMLAGELRPLTTLSVSLYQKVLDLLRLVIGLEGQQGAGKFELRSSWRVDLLEVQLTPGEHGIDTSVWLCEETTAAEEASRQALSLASAAADRRRGQLRRLRSSPSTILRLERSSLPDLRSGEISVPVTGEHDINDTRLGLHNGFNPSSERESAPLLRRQRPRPVRRGETWLRLLFAGCAALFTVAYFWQAYTWTNQRLATGQITAPWLDVTLLITSSPTDAQVSFEGQPVGRTPLRLTRPCQGRKVELVVRAEGFWAWQWHGFCPRRGRLELQAQLQPR